MSSFYKYKIEGSLDGKKWNTLVDQSANSITGTADGSTYTFSPSPVRYVRTTFLDNSRGKTSGGHIVEIQGFAEAPKSELAGRIVSTNAKLSPGDSLPENSLNAISETAWRGERINGKIALQADRNYNNLRLATTPLTGPKSAKIALKASFLRYVKGDGKLIADIIDENKDRLNFENGTLRQIWVSADIPAQTPPGTYKGSVIVRADGAKPVSFPVEINVEPATLPAPRDWDVRLDLWQHPEAVARYHDVPTWSKEHFLLLKPVMKRLADAGQKTITCSLMDEAWGGQTFDWWPSMIKWTKKADGAMTWDYTDFDNWVTFMTKEVGINPDSIICYSVFPWSMKIPYIDEKTGDTESITLETHAPVFEKTWGPFLTDFSKHLKKKGWFEKACIGIDERHDDQVAVAKKMIAKYAPGLKIAYAANAPTAQTGDLHDLSVIYGTVTNLTPELLATRKAAGEKTTFYVCCGPAKPNTFLRSDLAEAEWLGVFAAANNMDGILRWAYNSWNRNPLESTKFGNWADGDCFLVYPGNRSSVRFEKLRDGLETFEKINLLRKKAAAPNASPKLKQAVNKMNTELKALFTKQRGEASEHAADIEKANALINNCLR